MKKPIQCHVIKVDKDVTTCQKVGKTFMVDDEIQGKLCPAAQALVEAAADKMNANPNSDSDGHFVDVPCTDDYVTYRLTHVTTDEPDSEQDGG